MKRVTFTNSGKVKFIDKYGCHPSILTPGVKFFIKIVLVKMFIGLVKTLLIA